MSIEAMKRIKSLLQDCTKIDSHTISAVVAECDMAILAQQPATGEPVAWLDEMLADTREVFDAGGSETPQVVRDVIEYVKSWVTVYSEKNHPAPAAQPAPSEPATTEPVVSRNPFASRCYTMRESHLSGHRLIVGFEKLGDAQDAHEWVARQVRGDFTHPAPSVPATAEPVAWLDEMLADTREVFDANGSETPQAVRDVIEYVASWVTVYREKNHPAPSVPAAAMLATKDKGE